MHPNVCDIAAVGPRAAAPQRIGRILVNFELSDYGVYQDLMIANDVRYHRMSESRSQCIFFNNS